MNCPHCSNEVEKTDAFCEKCGTELREDAIAALAPPLPPPLAPPPITIINPAPAHEPCVCGASADEITSDGECGGCGRQRIVDGKLVVFEPQEEPEALPQNPGNDTHHEQSLNNYLAVVSDIGARTRHSNQDFGLVDQFVVGSKSYRLGIVCDGLSTSLNSAQAAKVACQAFAARVKEVLSDGSQSSLDSVRLGIEAAQAAVLAVPFEQVGDFDPPETTLVAALIEDNRVAYFGWVGDSRGYVLFKDSGRLKGKPVTRDHSWVNREVDAGRITIRRALQREESSTVLRSLGPLRSGEVFQPSFNAVLLDGVSAVLLCCDGIHKYVDPLAGTDEGYWHEVKMPQPATALALAKTFVDYANWCGGGDNNTAALLVTESTGKENFNPPAAAK